MARETQRLSSFDPAGLLLYAALHLGCLGVFWVGEVALGLAVCLGTYLARIFLLSVVYHRYFAHRSFEASRPVQFLFGLLGLTTMQRGPLWWAATHRAHHRFSDTPRDLHAPKHKGVLYAHSLWFLDKRNIETDLTEVADLARYPELRFLDRTDVVLAVVAAYGAGLYALFGASGFVWGFFVSTVLSHHATHCVQSVSHTWRGYRRYETGDDSRNHWLLGVLAFGEFHNNHHRYPRSARQGHDWWELDAGYFVLRGLERLGLVRNLKVMPSRAR